MQAYKIMARHSRTGVRIQQQDLTGRVVTELDEANRIAQELAQKQSARTRDSWLAEVEIYTVKTQ
jgi:hypothetical protein